MQQLEGIFFEIFMIVLLLVRLFPMLSNDQVSFLSQSNQVICN